MLPVCCCTRYFNEGHSVCPACFRQQGSEKGDLEHAREFSPTNEDLTPDTRRLMECRAVNAEVLGQPAGRNGRSILHRNPARRAVYRLLGIYLPEREAKALLKRVHEFKWIEAEKAGCDIWSVWAEEPLQEAAHVWAQNYLPGFLQHAHAA